MSKKKEAPSFSNKYPKKQPDTKPVVEVVVIKPTPAPQPVSAQSGVQQTRLQTIEQARAKHALDWAKNGVDEKTSSAANSLPAMILMNGLGQAAAFYKSKGGEQGKLYTLLSDWLCAEGKPYAGQPDLLTGITTQDMHKYRVAQAEALAYLQWVKKFAKAYAA